ncbi:hypothetical protein HYH02_015178 [Chlamydomonas schloesseri]|uniref:Uncharacterized protein n=1 Tax=Chlamydomonas schloesseri TaxID=2026947 RepID=A0A835SJ44_9CHLO|nr:hypothetical protein HYH02_015178 [Chlamydomonas schloesseri]|eukprot:KAG2424413.1 hypothetical protein HYH02_015178 [Chlamydomonas schloesseri]
MTTLEALKTHFEEKLQEQERQAQAKAKELEDRIKTLAQASNAVRRNELTKQAEAKATTILSRSALSQQQRHTFLDWTYDNIHVQLGKYILIAKALLHDGIATKDWATVQEAEDQLGFAQRFILASVAALEDASGCKQLQTEVYQQHLWQLRGPISEAPANKDVDPKLHIVDEDRSKAVRKAIEKRKGVHPETEPGVTAKGASSGGRGDGSSGAKRMRGGGTGGRGRHGFGQQFKGPQGFGGYDDPYNDQGPSASRSGYSNTGRGHPGGGHAGGSNAGRSSWH